MKLYGVPSLVLLGLAVVVWREWDAVLASKLAALRGKARTWPL